MAGTAANQWIPKKKPPMSHIFGLAPPTPLSVSSSLSSKETSSTSLAPLLAVIAVLFMHFTLQLIQTATFSNPGTGII